VSTADDPFLTAALTTAAHGWPVIPLRPGTKKPAFHGYDRCPHTGPCATGHQGWEHRAMTDPDEIRWYWTSRRYTGCNVGLATGPAGLVVIDLDVPKPEDGPRPAEWDLPGVTTGEDVFLVACDQAGQVPPLDTYTVATASGGAHLYYTAPEGVRLRNSAGTALGWKVDTRAHGGFIVAPGSIVHGTPYTTIVDTAPMPLPGWLCDRLAAPPPPPPAGPVNVRHQSAYVDAAVRDSQARVRATKANRNAALYGAAVSLGQLVAGGQLSERQHAEALMAAADAHINAGAYSARQAAQTITSGLRAGMRNPRQVAA
jgi:hypothetical protein